MNGALATGRQRNAFCFLCCLVYFMSYLTRMNYAACLAEIQDSLGPDQEHREPAGDRKLSDLRGSASSSAAFWGTGFLRRKMIAAGLAATCACNLLVGLFPDIRLIIPVWCLNGLFQSMLWPPLVRIMAETLDEKQYQKCCVQVSMASSVRNGLRLSVRASVHPLRQLAGRLSVPRPCGSRSPRLAWFAGNRTAPGRRTEYAIHAVHVEASRCSPPCL